jgi:subtilisin family serine protease
MLSNSKPLNLFIFVLAAMIITALSLQAHKQYELRVDQEFIVLAPENLSKTSKLDIKKEASKIGEVKEKLSYLNGYRVVSDNNRVRSFALAEGVTVEKVIKYSLPKPIKKNLNYSFGCNLTKPEPTPEPTPTPTPVPTPVPVPPSEPSSQVYDWGVKRVNAIASRDTENVTVCILDTGIDRTHPDLKYVSGRNFTSSNIGDFQDRAGHGSHTAGLVAAVNNKFGVIGSSQSSLLIGKVLDDEGSGYNDWIAAGINWCVDQNADIISMSLGGPQASNLIFNALKRASSSGIWVFAAAGNDGSSNVGYPAGYNLPNLFSISATDKNDRLAYFSNYGKIDFACPGVDIYSTVPGGYDTYSGTSMATPICAGVAAYYMVHNTPLQVQDLGDPNKFGKGLLLIK